MWTSGERVSRKGWQPVQRPLVGASLACLRNVKENQSGWKGVNEGKTHRR